MAVARAYKKLRGITAARALLRARIRVNITKT